MTIDKNVKKELDKLIELGNKYKWSGPDIHRYLQEGGIILEPATFYSTIPQISEIEQAFEYSEDMPFAVHELFDEEVMRRNIEDLKAYSKEFTPPLDGDSENPLSFFWKNGMFSYSDAMSYYAIIRKNKPKTIIEIGSGFSTLVAKEAILRNGNGKIISIEPFPRDWLRRVEGVELIEKPVQGLSVDFFNEKLENGDILFIDSTHTVKSGSDCLHLYLRVLPRLKSDLFIHVHDVFLPYGFPLKWCTEKHIHWTEQYLLLAYMIGNPRLTVIFGSNFALHKLPRDLENFMHGYYPGGGGSLWLWHGSITNKNNVNKNWRENYVKGGNKAFISNK